MKKKNQELKGLDIRVQMPGSASLGNMYKDGFLPVRGDQELAIKDIRLGLQEWDRNSLNSREIYCLD